MDQYILNLINKEKIELEYIINIYLVIQKARIACLLEQTNCKTMNKKKFYKTIKKLVNKLNNKFEMNLMIIEENVDICLRLLICSRDNYNEIITELRSKKYEYKLGKILGMTFPGGEYYNDRKPRLIGRIYANSTNIYAETFVIKNYDYQNNCLENNLINQINDFNKCLSHFNIKCTYEIEIDDGIDYRISRLKHKDEKYIIENIKNYFNDIYNGYDYIKKYKTYIESIIL